MQTKTQPTIKSLTIDPTFDWSRCKCGARFQTTAELDRHFYAELSEHKALRAGHGIGKAR